MLSLNAQNGEESATGDGFKGHMVFMCNNSGFRSALGRERNKPINKCTTARLRIPFFSKNLKDFTPAVL